MRAHQFEAYEAVSAVFLEHDRANVAMACASGKTLVGMRIAESKARILILEPSLSLVRQVLDEARLEGLLDGRAAICVCSDKTVVSEDHWKVTDEELGIPVTTDSAALRTLLQQAGERCIVFCTYQSQPLLQASLPAGFRFDFAMFDEAHRTAGLRDRKFSVALSDHHIPIAKRLFLTATPRLFTETTDEDLETAFSMDDEATFGPRAYTLTFGDAIEREIIRDFQILAMCVGGAEVQEALRQANNFYLPQQNLPLELAAGQIALTRAIQSTGARRVITFHSTIEDAEAFSRDRLKIYKQAGVTVFHIHGEMLGRQRQAVINAFLSVDGPTVLTNCHCLTEGVDIPKIDMVGILCRKESVEELAQAIGRALRNSPGKDCGYVMLPLYVGEDETVDSALNRSDMGVTWEILHSLLESDGALTRKLSQPARSDSTHVSHTQHHSKGHLRVVASDALLGDLQRAISVRQIHRLAARWDVMAAAAARYARREGILNVPLEHIEDELPLGNWIAKQRHLRRRGRLLPERVDELSAIGMLWSAREARWAEGLKMAREFRRLHGHLKVPGSNVNLRSWLHNARQQAKRGAFPQAKRDALMELGIDLPVPQTVEDKLEALEQWRQLNPVGRPKKSGPDRKLGFFLSYTITRFRAGKLEQATVDRLAAIGIDVRAVPRKRLTGHQQFGEQSWDLHYEALKEYIALHDWHNLWRTREFNGLPIQSWVVYQRLLKRKGALTPARIAALDALGIHWNRKSDWWIPHITRLEEFHAEHGHLRLPKTVEFRRLLSTVTLFRNRFGGLPDELESRLQAINFPRTAEEEYWQWAIVSLRAWRDAHGPESLSESKMPPTLRNFFYNKKLMHRRGELAESKLQQLRDLGVPWAALDTTHTQMMARLTRLARDVGKANVEVMANLEPDLSEWLGLQAAAAARGQLSLDAHKELRRVGIEIPEAPPSDVNQLTNTSPHGASIEFPVFAKQEQG